MTTRRPPDDLVELRNRAWFFRQRAAESRDAGWRALADAAEARCRIMELVLGERVERQPDGRPA
jgi:hypothetical protein